MDPDLDQYVLEGDASMYANESGLVVPFVTRAGQEPDLTGQSEGATRVSGVSIQHTPATKLWFGQVRNLAGYRSVPHHHGEAETGGFVLSGLRERRPLRLDALRPRPLLEEVKLLLRALQVFLREVDSELRLLEALLRNRSSPFESAAALEVPSRVFEPLGCGVPRRPRL